MLRILLIFIFCLPLTPLPAAAQTIETYESLMKVLSEAEGKLLNMRSDLLAREAAMREPLWVPGDIAGGQVVEGEVLRDRIEGAVFVGQALGFEQIAIDKLSEPWRSLALMSSQDFRAATASGKIMEKIQARSALNRSIILRDIELMLENAQEQFATAMKKRDALRTALQGGSTGGRKPPVGAVVSGSGLSIEAIVQGQTCPADPWSETVPEGYEIIGPVFGYHEYCNSVGGGSAKWSGGANGRYVCQGNGAVLDPNWLCENWQSKPVAGVCFKPSYAGKGESYYNVFCILQK